MRLLDRYLLREFAKTLAFSLAAFTAIFIIVDVFEKLDTFIDAKAPAALVALFYCYQLPYILLLVLPVAMLLASMACSSQLARHQEMVAMKSAGLSLYRIFAPLFLLGLAVSLASLVVNESVVPVTNQRRGRLERVRIKKQAGMTETIRFNLLYNGAEGRQYYIKKFDDNLNTLDTVVILRFDRKNRLRERIDAQRGVWESDHWVLSSVIHRHFPTDTTEHTDTLASEPLLGYEETPEFFSQHEVVPDEMGYFTLKRYIDYMKGSDVEVGKYVVDLYLKLSFPFANLIILLFGLPLLANARKSGATMSFAISLLICFIFWGILQTGRALGHSANLSPFLAAWLPNLTFGVIGAVIFYRTPK